MAKDYYVILGAARSATREQIRDRFRQMARVRHPDRFQGAERQKAELDFQDITEAFNVLFDPERRRQHDLELARPESQSAASDASRLGRFHMEAGVQFYRDGNFVQAAEAFESAIRAVLAGEIGTDPRQSVVPYLTLERFQRDWHVMLEQVVGAHQRRIRQRGSLRLAASTGAAPRLSVVPLAGRPHAV